MSITRISSQQSEHPTSYSETEEFDTSSRPDMHLQIVHKVAGGMEDWEDLEGEDVDRYGFIKMQRSQTRGTAYTIPIEDIDDNLSPPKQRHSRRRLVKRNLAKSLSREPSRKQSTRSLRTQGSDLSVASRHSAMRTVANIIPYNRNRKLIDDAGSMLNLSPGLQDEDATVLKALREKEAERADKWQKMAIVIRKDEGQGMDFEFDPTNPKVIERTWKGIPDRWRATAWFSFLSASAQRKPHAGTKEEIITEFYRLQSLPSQDDIQIDLDVPRTISDHVMFRKRYQGGQRLLFRVLHALSLYFPITGYVQGMASLAATLLCYFDEERSFVMLVWMWKLRGIDQIYQPGFEGLMNALDDFQRRWLTNSDVAQKLSELNIEPTAYATRWYLTLFNLSVPFPAQLRIWDVFMLLGGNVSERSESSASSKQKAKNDKALQDNDHGIDVVHAASAALIHALRDVLFDSDFENAMRALTSFIPINNPDLFLKVTLAEYQQHHSKKKI